MVSFLQAPLLAKIQGIRHGYFTRRGGVSQGIFAELNVREKGDDPQHVQENRKRIAKSLGFTVENLVTVRQVHSSHVVVVDQPFEGSLPEVDGIITTTPGLLIGVMTADCVPILLSSIKGDIVAAVHAGWKGAIAGIVEITVHKMKELGAQDIVAALGPCIWQDNYEVSQEFYDNLAHEQTFFKPGKKPYHWQFDLPGYVISRLSAAGVQELSPSLADTYPDVNRFYSCRRATHVGELTFGVGLSGIGIVQER